jgi:hypothetical protein
MTNSDWPLIVLSAYFVIFFGGVIGIGMWTIKRRRERPPLEFKLLRGPGESLRQRVAKFEENSIFKIGAAAMVPFVAALATFSLILWSAPKTPLKYALVLISLVFLTALFFSGRWALRLVLRNRNDWLGYMGERVIGESLSGLAGLGYRVFHDIPAETNGIQFNIDHAVVGPNGIFAVETKTRRKGRARPNFEEHKVSYDGQCLSWPWAEDTFGLTQAENRARWLGERLNQLTGFGLTPQPVLALPGWYVVLKGMGPVVVANHKQLVSAISRARSRALTAEQIDIIARQLDSLCRYVED